jgi:hypothetical protein
VYKLYRACPCRITKKDYIVSGSFLKGAFDAGAHS